MNKTSTTSYSFFIYCCGFGIQLFQVLPLQAWSTIKGLSWGYGKNMLISQLVGETCSTALANYNLEEVTFSAEGRINSQSFNLTFNAYGPNEIIEPTI